VLEYLPITSDTQRKKNQDVQYVRVYVSDVQYVCVCVSVMYSMCVCVSVM
jgi:hypothetical protein